MLTCLSQNLFCQLDGYGLSPYFNLKNHYSFIDYAINSSIITMNHPMEQPYLASELFHQISIADDSNYKRHWINILQKDLLKYFRKDSLSFKKSDTNIGIAGSYDLISNRTEQWSRYRVEVFGYYMLPYIVIMNKTVMDQRFKYDDPLFYGDTNEWVYGRVEDAYVLFKYKALKLFGGRISRNLGIINEPSLILSDNPYSYDHFGFNIDTKRLRFTFLTTRLNDIFGYDIQKVDQTREWSKRFFSLHRIEINLLKNLQLGLTEVALYGGPNQSVKADYINPMNLFQVNQYSKGVRINGFWALELFWKPKNNITIFNQFLIDDIDLKKENRATYPDRLGFASKLTFTDLFIEGSQLYCMYNRIENWTYISFRSWENYVYHQKSMGYPKNSVENVRLGMDYFGKPPFIFNYQVGYERYGDQNFDGAFVAEKGKFPIGVVQKLLYSDFMLSYIPSNNFNVKLNIRWESYKNANHIGGKFKNNFLITVNFFSTLNANFIL